MDTTETPNPTTALDAPTRDYTNAKHTLDEARDRLHDAILTALRAGVKPSDVVAHTPYDRNHIDRLRRQAGIPGIRSRPTRSQ